MTFSVTLQTKYRAIRSGTKILEILFALPWPNSGEISNEKLLSLISILQKNSRGFYKLLQNINMIMYILSGLVKIILLLATFFQYVRGIGTN